MDLSLVMDVAKKKNQQDPNFEADKATRESKAADKALRRHGLHPGVEK